MKTMLFIFVTLLIGLLSYYSVHFKKVYKTTSVMELTMEIILLGLCVIVLSVYIYAIGSSLREFAQAQTKVNLAHMEYVKQMNTTVKEMEKRIYEAEVKLTQRIDHA